jgi:hypothetical protein
MSSNTTAMKIHVALTFLLLSFGGSSHAKSGDTLQITTHQNVLIQTDPNVGQTQYFGWGKFPKTGKFQRMYAELSFKCPDNLRCGEWDYLNYLYLRTRKGTHNDTLNWEIMRFITPYGFGFNKNWNHTWRFEITDFESLFRDSVEIEYRHTGYEAKNDRGWILNLKFIMVEGEPEREVLNIHRMYQKSIPYGNDAVFKEQTPEYTWTSHPKIHHSRIKIIQTGHGMDKPSNCAEFCPKFRYLKLDGKYVDTSLVWREDCGENPVYPQAGTWLYDRAGWCPGQNVEEYHYDFKDSGNQPHAFDLDMESYTTDNGGANYVITAYVVEYGPLRYHSDAAITDIIQPSKHPQHSRYNPICSEPIIEVVNRGSTPIYSIDVDYGISGGRISKHHWVGVLPYGQKTKIRLPYTMDWTSVSPYFQAQITKVNGQADQDLGNNGLKVEIPEAPKVFPQRVIVMFRTNNAFKETSWKFLDAGGNLYKGRSSFDAANTIYRDTIELYNGCFTFVVDDRGESPAEYPLNKDGLNWWGNTFDGAGAVQLRDVNSGGLLHTFNPDFGSEVRLDFSVGYAVETENITQYSHVLRAYPNPNNGSFYLDIPEIFVKNATPTKVEMYNPQGQLLLSVNLGILDNAMKFIDASKLSSGLYLVKLKQNTDLCTTKILIE